LYTEGYRIYTSIDFDIQEELQNAVDNSLSGFTAKEDGVYTVQGAGTCIDNTTGKVVAIVGGRSQDDLEGYTLNRAFQSVRQPGSALKPLLVYAPALERGYTQSSTVNDSQMSSSDPHAVSNSGNSYRGSITLRAAVMKSSNVATMRLYEELTPKTAWSYLEKMQFSHITDADLTYYTSCIGGMKYGVTTEEMASGYATLANDGEFRQPTCIEEITDATGNLITKGSEGTTKVYSKTAASRMTDVLQSVVTGGTGKGMKIDRFATAGKTGTTSEYKDGWFCGYTSRYTTAIWVGRDDNKTLDNLHGNTYPAYIWKSFMSDLHANLDSGEDLQTYTDEGVIGQESTSATTEAATTGSDGYNNDNTSSTGRMYSTTEAATTEAATTEVEVTTEENTNAVTEAETTTAEPAATPEGNNGESEE
jgi:membrane peptidoglycan carboxypeptidase